MAHRSHLVIFYFKKKFCVSARVGICEILIFKCLDGVPTLSKKVYLHFYLTQIVHSNGKMLFLAPNSCALLTFFKEKLCVSARVSKSLCLDRVYLCQKNFIFRLCLLHEDGIEACIPSSI